MKKLATLLLAAGMVVAASAPANAVDVKVDYRHRISFDTQSSDFLGTNNEKIKQRVRLGLTFAASENLQGYIQFQTGKEAFGSYAGTAGTDGKISVRQMFVDWKVPATPVTVRMGRQMIGFPAEAMGYNSVMDAGWGGRDGFVVSAPVADWLGLTALWTRTGTDADDISVAEDRDDDVFGLIANAKFDGFTASVYGAYADLGGISKAGTDGIVFAQPFNAVGAEGTAYWVGATAALKAFDPFTFALSFAYGSAETDAKYEKAEQEGWNVQAKASYELGFGTPVLAAWYGSGLDKDDVAKGEYGIMPSLGGYIAPTRYYHDAAATLNNDMGYYLPAGNWGVQVGIEGMSFLKDLSHDFLVTYIQGTNEEGTIGNDNFTGQYLTEEDSFVSFDLVSTYKIYKNLAAHLELAYIINDFDSKDAKGYDEDAWRAGLTFDFKF